MFIPIDNTPRPYAWGSITAIPALLGTPVTGEPQAELWLGTHPGSPSRLVTPAAGAATLAEWLAGGAAAAGAVPGGVPKTQEFLAETTVSGAESSDSADPSFVFGGPRLPFLLKILAAAGPLSLQAHPTAEQAAAGFARENALGIPIDAPHRNYRDPHPKPEIIYALSETFDALCGFREPAAAAAIVRALGDAPELEAFAARLESSPLAEVFEWLITRGPGVEALVAAAVAAAEVNAVATDAAGAPKTQEILPETGDRSTETTDSSKNSFVFGNPSGSVNSNPNGGPSAAADAIGTVRMLASEYPGDPGIVISLLLNRVTLRWGEALFLPAGNIHAYLNGLGVELMTASDNVLRGGLTPKHIDVPELLSVLDFTPQPVPWLRPTVVGGAQIFEAAGVGFALTRIDGVGECAADAAAIAICTRGSATVTGEESSVTLRRGDSMFVTPAERTLRFTGDAEVFVASSR